MGGYSEVIEKLNSEDLDSCINFQGHFSPSEPHCPCMSNKDEDGDNTGRLRDVFESVRD